MLSLSSIQKWLSLLNGGKYSTLMRLIVLFIIRFPDKKSTEAVANLAKRRNVYTPSSIQIHSRSSGSFSSSHGPQTPTFQGLLYIIKIKHLNVSNQELYSGTEYTVCVIGECEFVSLANPFTPVGKTTFLVKQ